MWHYIPRTGPFLWQIFRNVRGSRYPIWNNFFHAYVKNGLVASVRGPGGGYLLGKDASAIAVGAVITAVDESVDATRCQGKEGCQGGNRCLTHTLWRDLSERISSFLNNITLAELVNNQDILEVADRQNNDTRRTANGRPQETINVNLRA
ncbi:hypothetical protein YPD8_2413 [Yersinia pestis D182038]|nr:hypothetical protein YPD8_2413 [Yersinia pestis D182038]